MDCKNCSELFNCTTKKPKLLPNCGHSICQNCIITARSINEQQIYCPFDNIPYPLANKFNDNIYLLDEIKKSIVLENSSSGNNCEIHDRNLELFCLKCKKEVCTNCVLFGDHREHSYEQLKTQNLKFEKKLERYKSKLSKILGILKNNDYENQIEDIKNKKLDKIEKNFDIIKKIINEHEEEMKALVKGSFDVYKKNIIKFNNKVNNLNNKITDYVERRNFSQFFVDEKDKNDIKEIDFYLQSNDIKKSKELFEKKIQIKFNKSITSKIGQFCLVRKVKEKINPSKISEEEVNLLQENMDGLLDETIIEKKVVDFSLPKKKKTFLQNKSSNISGYISPMTNSQISQISNISTFSKNAPSMVNKSGISKYSNNSLISNFATNKKDFSRSTNKNKILDISPNVSPFKALTANIINNNSCRFQGKENFENFANVKIDKINNKLSNCYKKNKTILDLSNLGIDDRLIVGLIKNLKKMKKLRNLKINNNLITENGFKVLLKTLKDMSLESLSVSNNRLNKYAVDYLISFKKYNKKLRSVNITDNNIIKTSKSLKMKLKMLEQKNTNVLI